MLALILWVLLRNISIYIKLKDFLLDIFVDVHKRYILLIAMLKSFTVFLFFSLNFILMVVKILGQIVCQ